MGPLDRMTELNLIILLVFAETFDLRLILRCPRPQWTEEQLMYKKPQAVPTQQTLPQLSQLQITSTVWPCLKTLV